MSGSILFQLHELFFRGALTIGEDWGGPDCAAYTPFSIHVQESVAWILILLSIGRQLHFQKTIDALYVKASEHFKGVKRRSSLQRVFEVSIASLYFSMFATLLLIKVKTQAMVNLLQPCHIFLLMQGAALLFSSSPMGILLHLLMLPPQTGVLFAIGMPAINGLSDIEIYIFWIQHYLLATMPFYLFIRNNFAATKLCSFSLLFIGIWAFALLHFTVYEVLAVSFHVNPQFMLCPTYGMRDLFALFPSYMMFPSYRTFTTVLFMILAIIQSYLYFGAAKLIHYVVKLMFPEASTVTDGDLCVDGNGNTEEKMKK